MSSMNRVFCAITYLLAMVYKTSSIQCYYCNSANNSACLDVNMYEDEERLRIIPVVRCEIAIPSPVAVNFFCRKIVQTIYHIRRENEIRVTRGCGWVWSDRPCYQTSNRDHHEIVCGCTGDYCNAAEGCDPSAGTIIFLALACCLYFLRE